MTFREDAEKKQVFLSKYCQYPVSVTRDTLKNVLRLISLVSFSFLLISINAFAGPCDCPANDPLAGAGGCGVKPEGIIQDEKPFPKGICGTYWLGWLDETLRPYREGLTSSVTSKSNGELLDYMSCYRPNQELFCHYKTSLSPYIHYASRIAGIPFAVESCLLLKENSFNSSVKSGAGAMGYAQLMPNTLRDLQKCLSKSDSEWAKEIQEKNEQLKSLELERQARRITQEKFSQEKKYLESCKLTARARARVRRIWDFYWKGTKDAPKVIKPEMASCYRSAILLSTLKQSYDASLMAPDVEDFSRKNGSPIINGMNAIESAVFMTGAYNMGASGFAAKCGTLSLSECISSFPAKSETRQQLQGVRNCVQYGSLAQTQDPYNPKKRKANCKEMRCGR